MQGKHGLGLEVVSSRTLKRRHSTIGLPVLFPIPQPPRSFRRRFPTISGTRAPSRRTDPNLYPPLHARGDRPGFMHLEFPQSKSSHESPPSSLPESQSSARLSDAQDVTVGVPASELSSWTGWDDTQQSDPHGALESSLKTAPFLAHIGCPSVAYASTQFKSETSEEPPYPLAYDGPASAIRPAFTNIEPETGSDCMLTSQTLTSAPDFSVSGMPDLWGLHWKDSYFAVPEIGLLQVNDNDHSPGFFHFDQ